MTPIPRYLLNVTAVMTEVPTGGQWIKVEDHLDALKAAEERIVKIRAAFEQFAAGSDREWRR